jgi:4-diphosphocytidyl-2-C-methyl-D-erythritol kinase
MIVRPAAGGAVEALAPAKLNLFLEIHGRRDDGYHDLESLMVAVDLHDTLSFADDPSGRITLRCDDPTLPTGRENLVVRAAEAMKAASGMDRGATIELKKAIPAQAGLAGGSSDAACTLAALNLLWDVRMPPDRIDALAKTIGSDVAFFRHGPAAVCRGRGDVVEPRRINGPLTFVLVCPPLGVATADVYARLTPPERPRPIGPFLEALASGETKGIGAGLFNRLQPVAETLCPALTEVRDALAAVGEGLLDGHLMSGSGSAYFGLARDPGAARIAAARIAALEPGRVRVVTCRP